MILFKVSHFFLGGGINRGKAGFPTLLRSLRLTPTEKFHDAASHHSATFRTGGYLQPDPDGLEQLVDLTTLIAKRPVPVANMQDAVTVVALFKQTISQFLNRRRVKASILSHYCFDRGLAVNGPATKAMLVQVVLESLSV